MKCEFDHNEECLHCDGSPSECVYKLTPGEIIKFLVENDYTTFYTGVKFYKKELSLEEILK